MNSMNVARPTNRDVLQYRFPLTAMVSILHRVSGVVLFLALPLLLYWLSLSLGSSLQFSALQTELHQPLYKVMLWIILAALSVHWVAGLRHMIMDAGFAESLRAGQISAKVVVLVSLVLMVLAGIWLW